VIARGSAFRFRSDAADLDEVRRRLGVRYCLTGSVESVGRMVTIGVELCDASDGAVVWAERFHAPLEGIHEVREAIVASVVSAVELRIPLREASRARLRAPENIDAWSAYHLGLPSLYRFDPSENERAVAMLERAVALEPDFARAHAALSFAHFKTAFMHYAADRDAAAALARRAAETAIDIDPLDPFANFSMGRSLWLTGDLNGAQGWLERSTSLSPSFAHGLYARAWTETLTGSSRTGRRLAGESMALSPLDPLLYAMLATRAMSFAVEGRDAEAAQWSAQAANAPGAHDLIRVIAVFAHELAGEREAAARWARRAGAGRGGISRDRFFQSFPFSDRAMRARILGALAVHGIV
jgi:tetratricopeptide (TPR) repeat protein